MRHTSAFYFSVILSVFAVLANAQQPEKKDSVAIPIKTERFGIRVGTDLYKLARSVYDQNYQGFEIAGDYRLSKKFYVAGEFGNENKTTEDTQLNFNTKGSYIKIGFDYNTYENWLDMENMVYVGMRYGVSSFTQTLENYQIYNPHPYFGEAPAIASGESFGGLSASWIEVVAGVKVEIFNNLYLGFSARLNRMVSNKQPNNFENLYIPGFNRTYGGDFGAGFNYTISYFIPFYKKTVTPGSKK